MCAEKTGRTSMHMQQIKHRGVGASHELTSVSEACHKWPDTKAIYFKT